MVGKVADVYLQVEDQETPLYSGREMLATQVNMTHDQVVQKTKFSAGGRSCSKPREVERPGDVYFF